MNRRHFLAGLLASAAVPVAVPKIAEAVGSLIASSAKGPLSPIFISNEAEMLSIFGKPDLNYQKILDVMANSNRFWIERAPVNLENEDGSPRLSRTIVGNDGSPLLTITSEHPGTFTQPDTNHFSY